MHIAIAGNIGAGKTTLTGLLAKHYNWDTHFEDVDDNPYLMDFYDEMQRWSFNLQIYYLNSRFTQIQEIKKSTNDSNIWIKAKLETTFSCFNRQDKVPLLISKQ